MDSSVQFSDSMILPTFMSFHLALTANQLLYINTIQLHPARVAFKLFWVNLPNFLLQLSFIVTKSFFYFGNKVCVVLSCYM